VIHPGTVTQNGSTISSLQVGLNRFDSTNGAQVTDLTPQITALGTWRQGDAVAIGQVGFLADPLVDTAAGSVAMSVADPGATAGHATRIYQYKESATSGGVGTVSEITTRVLPSVSGAEKWQASAIQFLDIDGDGDDEMVLLANAAFGSGSALRILRNVVVSGQPGHLDLSLQGILDGLVTSPTDHFEGDCLAIGDLDGDKQPEFVISRAATGAGNKTRAIQLAK
jgi:hypothetical protein